MGKAVITNERFYSGLTLAEFVVGMKENRDKFEENLRNVELRGEDEARLAEANEPLRVVVIAEDWCGDVLRYLPVLVKMAEKAGRWEARVFYRDANPDLMERWLKDGTHRAIPVLAFFDEDWNEIGYYQEKPALVYSEEAAAMAEFARLHPDLPDAGLPYNEMSQETKDLYAPFMREFRSKKMKAWQDLFMDEVVGLLLRVKPTRKVA
ncbi:MAG: thioredoxin family protein [Chloroflexia bacterium]